MLQQKASVETNEQEQQKMQDMAKNLHAIALRLKSVPFKANVIKECADLFKRENKDFYEKLDSKENLIGFENGVFDLDTGEFRDGQPEDLITLSTRYDYSSETDPHIMQYLDQFLGGVSSSPETKQYLLDILSYACHGKKKFQDSNLNFWSGTGANGKGALKILCMKTFGEYGYEPDPSILTTSKHDSSRACPELAKLKGKRFACMSEPDCEQKLQVSMIKKMTGGDAIQALQAFFVVLMNNKPQLNDYDGGIARRLHRGVRIWYYENSIFQIKK